MSQLTADGINTFEVGSDTTELPVKDNVVIYRGSAVGVEVASGYARQLEAGDTFGGFAEAKVDNTVTGHVNGFKNVQVRRRGFIQLSVTGVAVTDFGADVYATDGNNFVKVAANNTFVGKVHRFISSGVCIVAFDLTNP